MLNSYNKCYILGEVVDIEHKQTKSGMSVSRVIVETKYKDSSDRIPCSFYGDLSNEIKNIIKTGEKIYVIGRITWQLTDSKKVSGIIAEQFFPVIDK